MAHHLEYFPLLERGTMIAPGLLFFFHTPGWQEFKDKNETGVRGLCWNGAAWESGCHFWPRDSLIVIINQPTLYVFRPAPWARVGA